MSYHWGDTIQHICQNKTALVMGIDPVDSHLPTTLIDSYKGAEWIAPYVQNLLEIAAPEIGIVKFQAAYFEAYGAAGMQALAESLAAARKLGLAIIMDAKRGDIGSTSAAYAAAYLKPGQCDLESDALTINPFLGPETLEPFFEYADQHGKGLFVLCKTSNPGSGWLQDQLIQDQTSVSTQVARMIQQYGQNSIGSSGLSNLGAVVGVTYPEHGQALRAEMPNAIILAPGLGAQGGKADTFEALKNPQIEGSVTVNASRGITKVEDRSMTADAYWSEVLSRIQNFKKQLL